MGGGGAAIWYATVGKSQTVDMMRVAESSSGQAMEFHRTRSGRWLEKKKSDSPAAKAKRMERYRNDEDVQELLMQRDMYWMPQLEEALRNEKDHQRYIEMNAELLARLKGLLGATSKELASGRDRGRAAAETVLSIGPAHSERPSPEKKNSGESPAAYIYELCYDVGGPDLANCWYCCCCCASLCVVPPTYLA